MNHSKNFDLKANNKRNFDIAEASPPKRAKSTQKEPSVAELILAPLDYFTGKVLNLFSPKPVKTKTKMKRNTNNTRAIELKVEEIPQSPVTTKKTDESLEMEREPFLSETLLMMQNLMAEKDTPSKLLFQKKKTPSNNAKTISMMSSSPFVSPVKATRASSLFSPQTNPNFDSIDLTDEPDLPPKVDYNQRAKILAIQEKIDKFRKATEMWKQKDAEDFAKIHEEDDSVYEQIIDDADPDDVLAEAFNLKVTRKDICTLRGSNWLNDEVINFYMEMITARGKTKKNMAKCHCFNTFFYTSLCKEYSRVRNWTKRANIDIFELDKVFVPVHKGTHWCMAVINFKEKKIQYYDSLAGGAGQVFNKLREYLKSEYKDKKNGTFDLEGWNNEDPDETELPQQKNGYDCGVFACQFAKKSAANKPFDFSQKDMPKIRRLMRKEILKKELV